MTILEILAQFLVALTLLMIGRCGLVTSSWLLAQ